ncbi:myoferlin-like isoform X2 [Lissotriton helveticus]
MLRLIVVSANFHLPPSSKTPPNSFVLASFRDVKRQTRIIRKDQKPMWNETLEWDLAGIHLDSTSFIDLQIRDAGDLARDGVFGSSTVHLKSLVADPLVPLSLTEQVLLDSSHLPTEITIKLKVLYVSAGRAESIDELQTKYGQFPRHHGGGLERTRKDLADKHQDFQVRVIIIQGRQLQGNNLKSVVRMNLSENMFCSKSRPGNNPVYNEIFFKNFHQCPSLLFDEIITIQVLNSLARRSQAVIGIFKLDLGTVYDAPGHVLLKKWLTLYDPENLSLGVRGYLQVSLYVLGAWDKAPVEEAVDEEDVEANILNAGIVAVRMGTITMHIYRAEDIPHMDESFSSYFQRIFKYDSNKKNFVDPYVEVTFGGKTLKTRVSPRNANPEWNQSLSFPLQVPSMVEKMKLTVLDWDAIGNDEPVGTTSINLSHVSSTGAEIEKSFSGFLPCFGPSFISLYGSPRENTGMIDPHEQLNRGIGEGVAYRGRVLVELETRMEESLKPIVIDWPTERLEIVERFLYRRKYGLCAVFYSATMLPEVKGLIQFEVSIGNYGNKFDLSCKPQASTTQYSQALFDGNFYHYLPWYDTLPVVVVTCFWEDITKRMDTLNILLSLQDKLESFLKILKPAGNFSRKLEKSSAIHLLQELQEFCQKPLPSLEGNASTVLDEQLWTLRQLLLNQVANDLMKLREDERAEIPLLVSHLQDILQKISSVANEVTHPEGSPRRQKARHPRGMTVRIQGPVHPRTQGFRVGSHPPKKQTSVRKCRDPQFPHSHHYWSHHQKCLHPLNW